MWLRLDYLIKVEHIVFYYYFLCLIKFIDFLKGVDANGKGLLYRNIFDCFAKTFKIEGTAGLYKGFVANYWRAAPHTVIHLTVWEQFKKWNYLSLSDEENIYFE